MAWFSDLFQPRNTRKDAKILFTLFSCISRVSRANERRDTSNLSVSTLRARLVHLLYLIPILLEHQLFDPVGVEHLVDE